VAVVLVVLFGVYPQPMINAMQKAATAPGLKVYDYKKEAGKAAAKQSEETDDKQPGIQIEPPPR